MGSKVVVGNFIYNYLKETTYSYFEVFQGENEGFLFPCKGCTNFLIIQIMNWKLYIIKNQYIKEILVKDFY